MYLKISSVSIDSQIKTFFKTDYRPTTIKPQSISPSYFKDALHCNRIITGYHPLKKIAYADKNILNFALFIRLKGRKCTYKRYGILMNECTQNGSNLGVLRVK